jgi:hypothetical protein
MSTYYFIKSKLDSNVIDIEGASTKAGALLDAYPQKTTGTENQMWEFVSDPGGSGYFFIKSKLNGNVVDIQGASTKAGALLDAYPQKTSGTENQLWQFYQDPSGSGYFFIMSKQYCNVVDIVGASTKAGAGLDAYPLKTSGTANQLWQVVGGTFPSTVASAPAPSSGLGSNSNYFMSNCSHITGLSTTINVSQDIVGSDGFGFQVNCYSAKSDYDGGQQYLIYLDPHSSPATLYCMVDNWTEGSSLSQIINHIVPLATLPSQKLPSGYQLVITLQNDSGGNITGANYIVKDNTGKTIGNQTITLLSLKLVNGNPVTTADQAPIVSFQMNFVDYLNGGITTLSSGAGTIVYSAAVPMSVLNTEPATCVDWDFSTVERANSNYGVLPNHANNVFVQTFEKSGAVIDRQAKVRHTTKRLPTS